MTPQRKQNSIVDTFVWMIVFVWLFSMFMKLGPKMKATVIILLLFIGILIYLAFPPTIQTTSFILR